MIAAGRRHDGTSIDWRDPLRMAIAGLLAYAAAQALHLPEAFWAVLSALIVSRPHRGGTVQAGIGRLAGTLAGILWAIIVAAGRHWQIAEAWLLPVLLLPPAALIAWRPEYRTAPIAAVIVFSSTPHGGAPLAAAALRLAEIALGAGIGMSVAWLLLPAGSLRRTERLTARLLDLLAATLESGSADNARRRAGLRRLLKHLTDASRAAPWEGGDHARAASLAALSARLHADIAMLHRLSDTDTGRIAVCRNALLALAAALLDGAPAAMPVLPAAENSVLGLLEQDIAALARLVG